MPTICRHHLKQGRRAVAHNPKYRKLSRDRKRQIADRIGLMLERRHGVSACKGPPTKIR